jgi:alpha-beta hydrolase superfamily lysophospholipase
VQETTPSSWFGRHRFWTAVLIILGILALFLALMQFLPVSVNDTSVSNPALNHDDAARRVIKIRQEEAASGLINPVCESILMSHGEKTENAIIFFHGLTSCPEQFRELGQQFYDQGYNVYIPRLPHHGHADRDRDALLNTTAEELAAFATQSVDIGQGLGDRLVAGGLSGGGTIAAWVAQEHADVDRAVAVAPFLGIGFIPTALNRMVARILDDIPNIDMWWDPELKENNPMTAPYAYPGYPLHALAEYLRLGFATQDNARREKPAVGSIVVITNDHDESVSNGITNQLVETWKAHGEEALRTYDFEETLDLPHDLITPTREDGNPGLVYPVIIDSIEQ